MKKAEEEDRRNVAESEESRAPDPWLRRVGWAAHVGTLDKQELRELVEPVGDDEPELQTLCKAFEWMIQDAQYHAVREVIGQAALFEAHKKEVNKEPNMPFDSWMDITTIKSYVGVWRQLLCYVWRAEEDEPDKRPPYKLTERQDTCLKHVRAAIQGF